MTQYLIELLLESGIELTSTSEQIIVKNIKESECYVACNFQDELEQFQKDGKNSKFELPDGKIVEIGNERIRCPEALFNPHFIGMDSEGIDKLTHKSIQMCDLDIRRDLYKNIVLSGGNTCFNG